MPVLKKLPLSEIKTDPQVRHSLPDIQEMADSIKQHGVLQHPAVQRDMSLLYGFRRLEALKLLGLKEAYFQFYEESLSPIEVTIIRVVENLQRVDLPAFDQAVAVRSLVEEGGLELKEVAARVGKSPAWASRMMYPWKCRPEIQDAFKAGSIGITDCEAMAKAGPEAQQEMLVARLAGNATRDDLARQSQRRRNGKSGTVSVNRIRFTLPSGISVTLAGQGLTLDSGIEAMQEGGKAMRKGVSDGLDAKTFQATMACKAKQA